MKKFILFLAISLLVGFTTPPKNTENICRIFKSNPSWYWKAKHTENKWGVPVSVQMAIINQESHFNGEAKAHSSAYGFSQALRGTWTRYKQNTGAKGRRNEFAAATDFIGWYLHMTKRNLGISPKNTYALYLAYHEGLGGYRSHRYQYQPGLMRLAKRVETNAIVYKNQLAVCESQIKQSVVS